MARGVTGEEGEEKLGVDAGFGKMGWRRRRRKRDVGEEGGVWWGSWGVAMLAI